MQGKLLNKVLDN